MLGRCARDRPVPLRRSLHGVVMFKGLMSILGRATATVGKAKLPTNDTMPVAEMDRRALQAWEHSDFDQALSLAREALVHSVINRTPGMKAVLNIIVGTCLMRKEGVERANALVQAVPYLSAAAAEFLAAGDQAEAAKSLEQLASLWADGDMPGQSERFLRALELYGQSLKLAGAEQLNTLALAHSGLASLCHNLADAFPDRHRSGAIYHRLQACWFAEAEANPHWFALLKRALERDCRSCGWRPEAVQLAIEMAPAMNEAVALAAKFANEFPNVAADIAPLFAHLRPAIISPDVNEGRRVVFEVGWRFPARLEACFPGRRRQGPCAEWKSG
jgi:hypothetical protein